MQVTRHGKPKGSYLATLRKPKKTDYDLLVKACMEAIISGENDVTIAFSYITKFPAGFPRGLLETKVDDKNIHRIKARKLLTWLHKEGHTLITVESLKQQRVAFTKFENIIDEMLDANQTLNDNTYIETDTDRE
jgi:hypothetical protein